METITEVNDYIEGEFVSRRCSCGKINDEIDSCQECNKQGLFGVKGWICPVCGSGLSPLTSKCPCIDNHKNNIRI